MRLLNMRHDWCLRSQHTQVHETYLQNTPAMATGRWYHDIPLQECSLSSGRTTWPNAGLSCLYLRTGPILYFSQTGMVASDPRTYSSHSSMSSSIQVGSQYRWPCHIIQACKEYGIKACIAQTWLNHYHLQIPNIFHATCHSFHSLEHKIFKHSTSVLNG